MKVKARPLADRVLVLPVKADDRSPGGVLLPDIAKQKPLRAEVIAVGPGRLERGERIPVAVKVGEVVLFGQWAGQECRELGDMLLIREDDILAVLEK